MRSFTERTQPEVDAITRRVARLFGGGSIDQTTFNKWCKALKTLDDLLEDQREREKSGQAA